MCANATLDEATAYLVANDPITGARSQVAAASNTDILGDALAGIETMFEYFAALVREEGPASLACVNELFGLVQSRTGAASWQR